MNVVLLLMGIALGLYVLERVWPAAALPKVQGWWGRVACVNLVQLGVVLLAGITWDQWFQRWSVFNLSIRLGDVPAALLAYLVSCVVYYWWHRLRHESNLFWRLCHQLHHSPRRI